MVWKNSVLGDHIELLGGGTPSKSVEEYWNGNIPWASVKDLKNDHLKRTEDSITPEGVKFSATRVIPKGQLIIATRMAVGKVVITDIDVAINQDLKAIKCDDALDKKFLFYLLKSKGSYFEKISSGATVKGIKIEHIKKLKVTLPPLPIQKKIAAILDAADAYRQKTKALIEKYDELTQSLFLEMFGDPVKNPSNWKVSTLVSNCKNKNDIKCGPFGTQLSKSEYVQQGVPIWGIPQVNSSFEKKPTEFVTEEKAIELSAYSVKPYDIVMSRKGNVGKCALFSNLFENGILHSDVLRIRTDCNKVLPIFLVWQFRISRILQTQVSNVSNGAIMAGINVTKLKQVLAQVPPLELQKDFAERVISIEKQKKQTIAAIDKSEQLFQSLLQKAFKGELVN